MSPPDNGPRRSTGAAKTRVREAGFLRYLLPLDASGEGYGRLMRDRWAEIGFCGLFVFASGWGQTFVLSLYQAHWRTAFSLSEAGMGALYGGATLLSGALLPLVGRWIDRTSTWTLAFITLSGLMVASLLTATAQNAAMLGVALFALRFFGQGMSALAGLSRAARWFTVNRGKAISLSGLGFPLGEATLPWIVVPLILWLGWRQSWIALGIATALLIAPLAFYLLREKQRQRGRAAVPTATSANAPDDADRKQLLTDPRFYAMLVVSLPMPFFGTGIIFFQAEIATAREWGVGVFPTGFLIFAIVRALFSLSAGAWADRIGAVRLLALPTSLFALGLFLLTLPGIAYTFIFFALMGIGYGAASGVMTTAWTDLFGSERIGLVKGISGSVMVGATAVAPVAFGWAFGAGIALNTLLYASALSMIFMAWPLCLWLARAQQRP